MPTEIDVQQAIDRRVFIPEPNRRFEFDKAKVFGPIIFIHDNYMNPFNFPQLTENIKKGLIEKKFNPEIDVVCMTGNVMILAVTLAVLSVTYDKFKLLMFDARDTIYVEKVFDSPRIP